MKKRFEYVLWFAVLVSTASCGKSDTPGPVLPVTPATSNVQLSSITINAAPFGTEAYGIAIQPEIKLTFTQPLDATTLASATTLVNTSGQTSAISNSLSNNDSTLVVRTNAPLEFLSKYVFNISTSLKSKSGGNLNAAINRTFFTRLDSSRKFPVLTDAELLDKVQQQTFKYFWDFGHPVSGLARERNSSGDLVTSGGTGFGILSMVVAVHRNFITRSQALTRLQTMVSFLKNTAQQFHGAFPHWLNGNTGAVIPFSAKDNGADLVETSLLMEGLLTARQYFNANSVQETNLRNDINALWNGVEWDWFRNNQNVLYWHWSPNYNWDMNVKIQGWNECLISYVLAASSTTHTVPNTVYTEGWSRNGAIRNGGSYFGYTLPVGSAYGGPLFLSHYSFLGIDPRGLSDVYGNYETQTRNHSLINYSYCAGNGGLHYGYSDSCWGLTACDVPGGYAANSPSSDLGVIAPTAALSSMPYTPTESMKALRFFYEVLGDKLWSDKGFYDAFRLQDAWFANSTLAIDQGPIIVMIENYRSGLLWQLFTSCPEVKTGMRNLGFSAPYL